VRLNVADTDNNELIVSNFVVITNLHTKGAFTLAIFARDFALSLHVLQNKNNVFHF
jgi:hypothetical protein